jgi:basic membrane lipoprotein Med (substrate-binding protein (PBP1-ABC) superfamily)
MNRHSLSTAFHSAVLISAILCLACASEKRAESASDHEFKVALLTPGPISDQSWNGGAYAGLTSIHDSIGAVISHIQTSTPAEFEENFRQYGAQKYDLVFGHGFEFQDAAERVAPDYPGTVFVIVSGSAPSQPGKNVGAIEFGFDGASYLAGIVAGRMSRSGIVGTIGGTSLPPVESSFRAFEAGASSEVPNVRVLSAYVGNWDDATAGRELALAQIRQGADIIFQNADAAGLGVFQAARQADGVRVFGSNADQNSVAPKVTLGSVVIDLPKAFLIVAREVHDGKFSGRLIRLGAEEDVVRLALNPVLESSIPASIRSKIDSLHQRIVAGTFTAPGADSTP